MESLSVIWCYTCDMFDTLQFVLPVKKAIENLIVYRKTAFYWTPCPLYPAYQYVCMIAQTPTQTAQHAQQ